MLGRRSTAQDNHDQRFFHTTHGHFYGEAIARVEAIALRLEAVLQFAELLFRRIWSLESTFHKGRRVFATDGQTRKSLPHGQGTRKKEKPDAASIPHSAGISTEMAEALAVR